VEVPLIEVRVPEEVTAGGAGKARVAIDVLPRPPVHTIEIAKPCWQPADRDPVALPITEPVSRSTDASSGQW
jgi:hypothetical protein